MPPLAIALLGCGRVGRNLVRILAEDSDLRIAAIQDRVEPEQIEYLLRFDSLHGRFPGMLRRDGGDLVVAGRRATLLAGPEAPEPDWRALGIDVVVVAHGRPTSRAEAERHLERGAKRVVLCVPPTDAPDATIVFGVNEGTLDRAHRIVSIGSVTANCVAPVLKVLLASFGIKRAFLTSVHAYGSRQALADVPAADMRNGRAAAENIIPQQTNADELIAELLPELAGRLSGISMNVPVSNGSVVDLTCWHPRPVSAEEINAAMSAAAAGPLARTVAFETEPIVSSDVLKSTYSGTFDSLSTMVVAGKVSKTLTFYDNAWGYGHRAVDLLRRLAAFDGRGGSR
jgi:glyceraldehyde 3-phosphate dehydrogenase